MTRSAWMRLGGMLLFTAASLHAQPFNYTYEPVATNLNIPVRLAFPPDGSGRLFYLELFTGNVQVTGSDSARNGTWLHLDVAQVAERGLLGIAFDPAFASNHYVYIFYTTPADTPSNRVERYTEVNWRADTASRMLLYDQSVLTPCGIVRFHNGGSLAFGRDGKLYIGTGENGCPMLSPSTTSPRGKILRIEPHIPAPFNAVTTNPFYDDGNPSTGNDDRIYAKGFRNPFGMRLSPVDSVLYVTENGPDCNDEIDRVGAGRDYGWRPACDASAPNHCSCPQDSPYTKPLWRITPTIAPTGLTIYTGNRYPELTNKLIFVDNNRGYIWAGTFAQVGDSLLVDTAATPPGFGSLFDIAEGPDGYLYISHFDAIRRIVPLPAAVAAEVEQLPRSLGIENFPNPFNPTTTFMVALPFAAETVLSIFDLLGRPVAEVFRGELTAGTHTFTWSGSNVSSGMYYYRLRAGGHEVTGRAMLLR